MSKKKASTGTTKRSAKAKAAGRSSSKGGSKRKTSGAESEAPVLRQLPVYEFAAGGLQGYARLVDPDRGVEFCRCEGAKRLPAPCKEVLSLRHYLARGQGGLLTPREEAGCEGKIEKGDILFQYGRVANWPVATKARYELLSSGGLDATFAFSFNQAVNGFEAGVETLLPRMHSGIHVHSGGRWTSVATTPRTKRFYPRNLGAAELIADGRWNGLRRAGIGLAVEPQGYDYPMLVIWEPHLEWALACMALTEECSSVWVNGTERTVGLSLVGASVKAKSAVTCRVRVVLCQASELNDVLPYYREFVQEARSSRRR